MGAGPVAQDYLDPNWIWPTGAAARWRDAGNSAPRFRSSLDAAGYRDVFDVARARGSHQPSSRARGRVRRVHHALRRSAGLPTIAQTASRLAKVAKTRPARKSSYPRCQRSWTEPLPPAMSSYSPSRDCSSASCLIILLTSCRLYSSPLGGFLSCRGCFSVPESQSFGRRVKEVPVGL
jgi:hypothetical protein